MNKKLLNIKKSIEKLEEIEKLTLEARKTIKWNRSEIPTLKNKMSWEKAHLNDYTETQNDIWELENHSSFLRGWIKDMKLEKQQVEDSLKLILK